ncbi:Peptidase S54 [Macleaya cordata]|uniref:RHOMBOID-like protein n=1 Tax=Macleaya cordata TaxID=56857 RepID=A0A200Q6V1_MACCD|nr:Peptidase S54 [Macleaya cordata]
MEIVGKAPTMAPCNIPMATCGAHRPGHKPLRCYLCRHSLRAGVWTLVGIIYIFSAFVGSLVSALFVENSPAVGSSGALFGLLGSMLSGIIRNWKIYSDKFAALVALFLVTAISFSLGLLPHVDNFSNLGGFLSGFLLGFVLFFDPLLGQVAQNKKGLFEYNEKSSVNFKHKLDKPVLRSISLVLFALILAGGLVAVLHGVNVNKYCNWCHYINCIPSERWSCNGEASSLCEVSLTGNRSILTCKSNDKFRTYTFTNISRARIRDLCSQICS